MSWTKPEGIDVWQFVDDETGDVMAKLSNRSVPSMSLQLDGTYKEHPTAFSVGVVPELRKLKTPNGVQSVYLPGPAFFYGGAELRAKQWVEDQLRNVLDRSRRYTRSTKQCQYMSGGSADAKPEFHTTPGIYLCTEDDGMYYILEVEL